MTHSIQSTPAFSTPDRNILAFLEDLTAHMRSLEKGLRSHFKNVNALLLDLTHRVEALELEQQRAQGPTRPR